MSSMQNFFFQTTNKECASFLLCYNLEALKNLRQCQRQKETKTYGATQTDASVVDKPRSAVVGGKN